ncbi:MAG TPA: SprT family zinc-dependent metalloprotease [Thermodesulfovibrionales bacterium]|jgi:predicted metal-dependent hydrolase|nr:SprT family zinc-dependent metalloprotease [Thermodesulfovibrionales bacterium]
MNQITFGNKKISYLIKRGKRGKTVALHIHSDSTVLVLSPQSLEPEKIREIVSKRARWIVQKQEKLKRFNAGILKEFVSGESFPYLGRQYRLKILRSDGARGPTCKLVNGRFLIEIDRGIKGKAASRVVSESLLKWYMDHAKEKINERIERYTIPIGKKPLKIIIRDQAKRWASCSHSRIVRFNWKVIMTPISVFDYVVVHELCHLIHADHSAGFWEKVESVIPDYKRKREWLKENSMLLTEMMNTENRTIQFCLA